MRRSSPGIRIAVAFLGLFAGLSVATNASAADAQRQLWVTNAYGDDIDVFEVGTWKPLKKIQVGPNPHGISATADGKTVHIALENFAAAEGELLWLDTKSGTITGRCTVGAKPNENECTPDGKWIYVCLLYTSPSPRDS